MKPIDIPTRKKAEQIARAALAHMMKTQCYYLTGDLADSISTLWAFHDSEHTEGDTDCLCEKCKASLDADAPILAGIQKAFSTDPRVIAILAGYIVTKGQEAAA